MRYLIVTADDFGFTGPVNTGIIKSINEGVVTRTSLMVCTGEMETTLKQASEIEGKIGIHLQLTTGTPISSVDSVRSLVDDKGKFYSNWRHIDLEKVDREEVFKEWEAQIATVLDMGIKPTHIDTHHDVHRFSAILDVYISLAKKYNLSARPLNVNMRQKFASCGLQSADTYYDNWKGDNITVSNFITHMLGAFRLINNDGVLEFSCHPGFVDDKLRNNAKYVEERELEVSILCDPDVKKYLLKHNIQLLQNFESYCNA